MKIAFASDDRKTIATHFGRTRGFVIYEMKNSEILNEEYRANTFTGHVTGMEGHNHQSGYHGPILKALADCQVVIARGMGQRIYGDLQEVGVTAMITHEQDIQKALESYLQGKLEDHPDRGCQHD